MTMKRQFYISVVAALLLASCRQQDEPVAETAALEFGATIGNSPFSADVATRANGAGYGTTSYESTTFANDDVIGIFMTRHNPDPSQPLALEDIYKNYFNVGYYNVASSSKWTNLGSNPAQPQISVPINNKGYDFYAYYPWAPSGKTQIVTNCDNSQQIQFTILQDQAVANMPLCNVMRAVPVRNQTFDYGISSTWTVDLRFEHILSLIEFQISRSHDSGWDADDELMLDRVVVLGTAISTEGYFDIAGPDPDVKIKRTLTSKNSIFKADAAAGTAVPDAVTGATPGGRPYLRRTVIVPPVPTTRTDFLPEPGQQAEVEFLIALRWRETSSAPWEYTYRRYIAQAVTFESGKRYIFKLRVNKLDPPQHPISITAEQTGNWDDTFTWGTTFN